jgi:fimbrial chaperone protein
MARRLRIAGRRSVALFCALVASCACTQSLAAGLQVAPILLELSAKQNADGIWLSNTGSVALAAQVRVYHWTQANGEDALDASHDLVVSPPIVKLAPGARQLVRVIRSGAPPESREDAFRILVDELPVDVGAASDADAAKGLRFVLRYSVPVFLAPRDAAGKPKLSGRAEPSATGLVLDVKNDGATRAQLGNLSRIDAAGHRVEIASGLVGYVLAGSEMRWPLETRVPIASADRLLSRINGDPVETVVASVVTP